MNVLKIVIVSLFLVKLFAIDLYVPKGFSKKIDNVLITTKSYSSIKQLDLNNSFALVTYNDIPFILKNNWKIVVPIGNIKESILTHEKSLKEVNTIINLDFPAKILMDEVNGHYIVLKGSIEDFLKKKSDAIVYNRSIEKKGIYDFPLKSFGLEFNKYFIVTSNEFVKNYKDLMGAYEEIFKSNFKVKPSLVYKTLLISGLYLHKKVDFSKYLYKDYLLEKEKNEEKYIVGVTPNWPPFDIYQNGVLYGIGVDFWKLIAKKAHIAYEFKIEKSWLKLLDDMKKRRIDLTINTSQTPEREKYALFSKPYISFPLAIICRNDENFDSIGDIKSIAVGKNFTAEKLMKKHYPHLNYIETKNVFEALNMVESKKAQCAVDILPVILWTINKNHLLNLHIEFETPFKFHVQIMVRNDYRDLLRRINRAISTITPFEKERIINRYLSHIIVKKSTKHYYRYVLLVFVILAFIVFYILLKKNKKIEQEAFNDELTEILNRRGVLEKINNIEKGSVLFFDIDHFKNINDTYGHDFGDFVLKEIGKILKSSFRKSDIIGRWGGEEFVIILPNTDYKTAMRVAEKLRKDIENHNFDNVKVTISIGVSEYQNDLENAIKMADEALYKAKNSGRNQVRGYK